MSGSALYEGWVRHRRSGKVANTFRYGTYMAYIDLDAAEQGTLPPALQRRFRRDDHSGNPRTSLADSIRDEAERHLGRRPSGPIYLLTNLRHGGFVFNPVSFYYIWSEGVDVLDAVVAEVHNTPWGETHLYTIPISGTKGTVRFQKGFHVSPFMGMDHDYEWSFAAPGKRLAVHMKNYKQGQVIFDATLVMGRRTLTGSVLRALALRHPLATYAVVGRIYFQALKLWAKGARYFPHPRKAQPSTGGSQ